MRHITYKLKKNIKIKNRYTKLETKILLKNIILLDFNHSYFFPFHIYKSYFKYNLKTTSFRRSCLFTGRYRGYLNFMECSRFIFKHNALNGLFAGVKKAS
jgi:ribosomal protein S14